ncbi:hypothetical protein IP88_02900 [alpha proteobacterium AAP81b]|nr:hypothetical protein IP88_02900 [alpha proteobacterium AAP81b]
MSPLLIVVGLAATLAGCGGGGDAGKPRARPAQLVGTQLASTDAFAPRIEAIGTVTPLQSVAVKARADGQITRIFFREGDFVRAGQTLFQLDDRAARAELAQARAALATAEATSAQASADFKRAQALVKNGFVSGATLDSRRAAALGGSAGIDSARAAVSAAQTQLSYLVVRAPVSGRTGEINFRLGANVRAADTLPLVTINQLSPIQVRFPVPPEAIDAVRSAMRSGVTVTVSSRGVAADTAVDGGTAAAETPIARGRLAFLDNNVDPGNGSVAAKAEFANADDALWPGAIVTIRMPLASPQPRIALPEAAVQVGRDAPFVWLVGKDSKVMMRDVTIAGRADGRVYLAGGVAPGDRIVTDTLAKLKPGDPVRLKARPENASRAADAAPAATPAAAPVVRGG